MLRGARFWLDVLVLTTTFANLPLLEPKSLEKDGLHQMDGVGWNAYLDNGGVPSGCQMKKAQLAGQTMRYKVLAWTTEIASAKH